MKMKTGAQSSTLRVAHGYAAPSHVEPWSSVSGYTYLYIVAPRNPACVSKKPPPIPFKILKFKFLSSTQSQATSIDEIKARENVPAVPQLRSIFSRTKRRCLGRTFGAVLRGRERKTIHREVG